MFGRAIALSVLFTVSVACVSSTPGVTRASADNPLITIGAGEADVGGGTAWLAWYVIDTKTQTCWMKLGDSGAQLDCCALRRVKAAQEYITWTSCAGEAPAAPAPTT